MTINELSQLLDEIKGYVDDYRKVKEENKSLIERYQSVLDENNRLKEEAVEKDRLVASLQGSIETKDSKISELETKVAELNTKVAELEETANLNLVKAQEIVNELKEIVNAQ